MELFSSYNLIIEGALVLILSFWFNGLSKKTNIPSVLMLIVLGVVLQYVAKAFVPALPDFFPILEILGIVGLIMIVLEAALELELRRDKFWPIVKSLTIAIGGLMASTWVAALILENLIPGMSTASAWLYATPLSILSSAIIIPSVGGLSEAKKEFHVYESTFSDIAGIILFYFLAGQLNPAEAVGPAGFAGTLALTLVIALVASYVLILIFQSIKTQAKQFLLIAVLLLLYALGKKLHLSSLIIILVFGLVIANMKLFFAGPLRKYLKEDRAKQIYHELHIITLESAFVVRTFFFVVFGLTIVLSSLLSVKVLLISVLILASIYLIRFIFLRVFFGSDIRPQLFIAPRGLITVLLFYGIPMEARVEAFEPGILLFIIIGTSLIMTWAMIRDKQKMVTALDEIEEEYDKLDEAYDAEQELELSQKPTPETGLTPPVEPDNLQEEE
ncbi:NhaP-type Na+/H+ or K+/H+ antiporter [Robiginitalea myxolifaciens]|uniref:NhaP-type Na+/H+ or K+/H+ antiporter n=1 Tax=Robiginitalea myxolifaciens TaxID=400055 RepID=A0A1I6FTM8_9FLAO|nr:cation:proton antiporter [Robiginitalea myxolifaciens]SFR33289.1 NhaP-type Na+/H+ or K+/H+ antiporter [Robiginitalea myxolifaciens]